MVVAGPVFLSLALVLLGGQAGAPLSLPPLPPDPVMAHVAPADCMWYLSWSGVAEPDAKSSNQTEQLLAEPEVRNFIHVVGRALSSAIRKGAPPTPEGRLLGAEGPHLIYVLLTHPAAAFISKAGMGPQGLDVEGGIIVGAGDETDKVKATLEKLEAALLKPGPNATGDKAVWHAIPTNPGMPKLEWGFRGKYLIVGIGDGSADAISARTDGPEPEWLSAIKKKLPVERVSIVHYLNVNKTIAAAAPMLGLRGPSIIEGLGFDKVKQFANVSGLDASGCVSKSWLQVDGDPSGLLTIFGPEPLTAAELAPIPKDASLAVAARVHPAQLWTTILGMIDKIDAETKGQVDDGISQMESALGFHLQEDLLQTLGDYWCIYNSPSEGGLIITGLTVVATVKDHDRLIKTNDLLVRAATRSATAPGAAGSPDVTVSETTFAKQKIFSLKLFHGEMPFVPSWCITDKHLVVALSPQNIRAFLSRSPSPGSLADLPSVADKLKAKDTVLLTYQDTAGIMKITYPVLQMLATAELSALEREGLDIDPTTLPSLACVIRHVEPATSTLLREKDGLVYISRQSMPVDMTLSGLIPAWTLFLIPMRHVSAVRAVPVPVEEKAEPPTEKRPAPEARKPTVPSH